MASGTEGRAFVIMPFGKKSAPDGTQIDFDLVYCHYLKPAVEAAGLRPHRADADRRGGAIHGDMFQELLLAEFVVADLTLDNPNVWYEVGVRHALRASGVVLTYALRDRLPFDLAGQRMQRYELPADPAALRAQSGALAEAITATLRAWRGRKASPVYAQLPSLREPDWRRLRVGDVNEVWEALEAWEARIAVAQRKERPGDILLLADETPNRTLALDALRTAAQALLRLQRPGYALEVLDRALVLDPDDHVCRQLRGTALGRLGRFEDAREALQKLAKSRRDGETLGLLGRTWKDQWTRLWRAHAGCATDPQAAAQDTAPTLAKAAEAYAEAFRADPADHYPGINALLLGRIWEHVTGRPSKLGLDLVEAGLRWLLEGSPARTHDYWSLVTRAELRLLAGQDSALDDYGDAAALAVDQKDRFALDSASQTLDLLAGTRVQAELARRAAQIIDRAEAQLGARPAEHRHVVLFSGHMVDRADRPNPRFPEAKAEAAGLRIAQELDALGVGPGDLGVSQAACGGDLLFTQACLVRGMQLEIHLPQPEPEFMAASVSYAARHWLTEFDSLRHQRDVTLRIMPDELGPPPEGVDIYDRCNRWMLYAALSNGLARLSFVALWDGKSGDGPGGTEHMAALVGRLTGRPPAIIDPAAL